MTDCAATLSPPKILLQIDGLLVKFYLSHQIISKIRASKTDVSQKTGRNVATRLLNGISPPLTDDLDGVGVDEFRAFAYGSDCRTKGC